MSDGWPRFREAGDSAALLQWEPVIDAAVNARAIAAADAVRSKGIAGVRDVVSTFRSVAVYFDPLITSIDTVRAALLSSRRNNRCGRSPCVAGRGCRSATAIRYPSMET